MIYAIHTQGANIRRVVFFLFFFKYIINHTTTTKTTYNNTTTQKEYNIKNTNIAYLTLINRTQLILQKSYQHACLHVARRRKLTQKASCPVVSRHLRSPRAMLAIHVNNKEQILFKLYKKFN